jgi:hypothetical protein
MSLRRFRLKREFLAAEEVLVRGSEEPAQEQYKVLLRGTDGSAGTGEQELLRSSDPPAAGLLRE